jgi:chromate transporter
MLGVIAYQFLRDSSLDIGLWQTLFLAAASYILMEKIKVHPALVILVALGYGAVFLR